MGVGPGRKAARCRAGSGRENLWDSRHERRGAATPSEDGASVLLRETRLKLLGLGLQTAAFVALTGLLGFALVGIALSSDPR